MGASWQGASFPLPCASMTTVLEISAVSPAARPLFLCVLCFLVHGSAGASCRSSKFDMNEPLCNLEPGCTHCTIIDCGTGCDHNALNPRRVCLPLAEAQQAYAERPRSIDKDGLELGVTCDSLYVPAFVHSANEHCFEYIVQKGDSCRKIALQVGSHVARHLIPFLTVRTELPTISSMSRRPTSGE